MSEEFINGLTWLLMPLAIVLALLAGEFDRNTKRKNRERRERERYERLRRDYELYFRRERGDE